MNYSGCRWIGLIFCCLLFVGRDLPRLPQKPPPHEAVVLPMALDAVVLLDGQPCPLKQIPDDAVVTALKIEGGEVVRIEFKSK